MSWIWAKKTSYKLMIIKRANYTVYSRADHHFLIHIVRIRDLIVRWDACWRSGWNRPQCKTRIRQRVAWKKSVYFSHDEKFTACTCATKKKEGRVKTSEQNTFFAQESRSVSGWVMLSAGVSKSDYKGLIFIDSEVKISDVCYCDVLLSQLLLPV